MNAMALTSSIILLLLLHESVCVEIRDLSVPSLVSALNASSVVLDCDYEYSAEEQSQLDVKWYFGDDPSPFFQWLPAHQKNPQILGDVFVEHIDVDFVAEEEEDLFKSHRSIRILEPSPALSGAYRCKVSTFTDEDFAQANMLVYAAPKEVAFAMDDHETLVNLTCEVDAVYPQPTLTISWHDKEGVLEETHEVLSELESDGLFNARLTVTVSKETLATETTFTCDFVLPETNVNLTQSLLLNSVVDESDIVVPEEHMQQNKSTTESYEDYYSAFEDDFYYVSSSTLHLSSMMVIVVIALTSFV